MLSAFIQKSRFLSFLMVLCCIYLQLGDLSSCLSFFDTTKAQLRASLVGEHKRAPFVQRKQLHLWNFRRQEVRKRFHLLTCELQLFRCDKLDLGQFQEVSSAVRFSVAPDAKTSWKKCETFGQHSPSRCSKSLVEQQISRYIPTPQKHKRNSS